MFTFYVTYEPEYHVCFPVSCLLLVGVFFNVNLSMINDLSSYQI